MAQETRQVNGKLIEINGSVCDVQSTPVHGGTSAVVLLTE